MKTLVYFSADNSETIRNLFENIANKITHQLCRRRDKNSVGTVVTLLANDLHPLAPWSLAIFYVPFFFFVSHICVCSLVDNGGDSVAAVSLFSSPPLVSRLR